VGGFLVSRLVQLSSEREGLRRQLVRAQDEMEQVAAAYNEAHLYRQKNSQQDFRDWVIDDLIQTEPDDLSSDTLLADNIPRGSSAEEIAPYLDQLIAEVAQVKRVVLTHVRRSDENALDLDDLRKRGLQVPAAQENTYLRVIDWVAEHLPRPNAYGLGSMPRLSVGSLVNPAIRSTELRRLDESIREEQDLRSRKTMLESEVSRMRREISIIGRPTGVTSAIVILAIYSVLGIVAPVIVMGLGLESLAGWLEWLEWLEWLLVGLFALGLSAVLGYIFWYAKTLNNPVLAAT
jgi:hypothetical protein